MSRNFCNGTTRPECCQNAFPTCLPGARKARSGENEPSSRPVTERRCVDLWQSKVAPELNHVQQPDVVEDNEPGSVRQFGEDRGAEPSLPGSVLRPIDDDEIGGGQSRDLLLEERGLDQIPHALLKATIGEITPAKDGALDAAPFHDVVAHN